MKVFHTALFIYPTIENTFHIFSKMTIHHFSRMNLFLNAFNLGYKHNYVRCMRGQEQVIGMYPTYSNKKM